jgi:hypothetical protein
MQAPQGLIGNVLKYRVSIVTELFGVFLSEYAGLLDDRVLPHILNLLC